MAAYPTNWLRRPLGAVANVISGYSFKSDEFCDKGIPVIKIGNIRVGSVDLSNSDYVASSYLTLPERYHIRSGDILISLTGSHISQPNSVVGRVARHSAEHPECLLNQRAGKVVMKDSSSCDAGFLFYALSGETVGRAIALKAHGAASQANVSPTQVESIELDIPPLPMQRRISMFLSSYDELIENNQRRIRILEEMASSLYREWFVQFRFPGHETHALVESTLGKIPQGWDIRSVDQMASFLSRGMSPSYDEDGDSVVINQKCIRDQRLSLKPARRQNKKVPQEKLIRYGDVLVNSTGVGTLGRVTQVLSRLDRFTADSHVTIVRPKEDVDVSFFGCSLLHLEPEFERLGVGATGQTELSRASIGASSIICSPKVLQLRFGELIAPIRDAAICYGAQVENLRQTRNLLLPRLLSGQIKLEAH